jgi:hypothetical protein
MKSAASPASRYTRTPLFSVFIFIFIFIFILIIASTGCGSSGTEYAQVAGEHLGHGRALEHGQRSGFELQSGI